jgi:hypothetical protein
MANTFLYSGFTDSQWESSFHSNSAGQAVGSAFHVAVDGYINTLRWYRKTTGANDHPTQLNLWLLDNGQKITGTTSPPDTGAVGWQSWTLPTSIGVTAGTRLIVAGAYPLSYGRAQDVNPLHRPTPGLGLAFETATFRYSNTSFNSFPESNTTALSGHDVGFDTVATNAGPGPIPGTELADWLSTTDNLHQTDGLPWLTKVVVDATKNAVDASKIVIDSIPPILDNIPKAGDAPWVTVQKLWQIAGVLTNAEIDLWNLFAKRAPGQLTGPTPGGGSAFFGPSGGQVAERSEVAATNGELLWHRTQTTNWLDPVPGGDWVLEDTLSWDGPIGWIQPADCYVLNITAWPDTWDRQDIGDRIWLPRALWWAPLTDTLPAERRFADFDQQILHQLPLRSAGILLRPSGGFSGTLEAWLRPTPAGGIPLPPIP